MDEDAKKEFLKEFKMVAKAANDVADRAGKVPDTELSCAQYMNLVEELCSKVHGLKRLACRAEMLEGMPPLFLY